MQKAIKTITKKMKIFSLIILSIIVLILFSLIILHVADRIIRTPKKLLQMHFDIDLKDFDYKVETFEDQWYPPHGKGHTLVVYKFNKLTQNNIDYIKSFNPNPLPISETNQKQLNPNEIPKQFLKADKGYYLFKTKRDTIYETSEGFKDEFALDIYIFIIDIEKEMAVLYYRFM